MKKITAFCLFVLIGVGVNAQELNTKKSKEYLVTIDTEFGKMYAILYDDTPEHKKNFIKLANDDFYDSTTFHRIIKGFMIQGGDPNSKDDNAYNDGQGGPGYTTVAEFRNNHIHKKGALSAARQGDQVNPEKRSSGSQFYIVQGKKATEKELENNEKQKKSVAESQMTREILYLPENAEKLKLLQEYQRSGNQEGINELLEELKPEIDAKMADLSVPSYTDDQKELYTTVGGTPFLDGDYTVFGEVIKGFDVIDKIASAPKGASDRPVNNIYMKVEVELMKKKAIEKLTGYSFD